jgi:hypothetical protein
MERQLGSRTLLSTAPEDGRLREQSASGFFQGAKRLLIFNYPILMSRIKPSLNENVIVLFLPHVMGF